MLSSLKPGIGKEPKFKEPRLSQVKRLGNPRKQKCCLGVKPILSAASVSIYLHKHFDITTIITYQLP